MTLLEKIQLEEIQKLRDSNLSLKNKLQEANQLLREIRNVMKLYKIEVKDAEVVEPNPLDDIFQSPIEELRDIFKNMC
jgi:hypothetical protein